MALLIIGSEACYTWQAQKVEPRAYIEAHHPDALKVYRVSGKPQTLRSPRIEGDSLVGETDKESQRVALTDITKFSARRVNPALTVLGVVGTLGVIAVIACVTQCQISGPFDNMGS